MSNLKVTVIVTCYNYGKYVSEAIDSILDQTHVNIYIIVINDGSTDNSSEVLKKYNKINNIRVIDRENQGVIATRNQGIDLADGDFVMQLDADDTLHPKYIELCLRKAHNDSLDIIYTQAHLFGRTEFDTDYKKFNLEKLKHDNFIHASSMIRRSILQQDPYDKYLDKLGYEDWDLFLGLCLDGAKAGLVDKPLLNYRKHVDRNSRADAFGSYYKELLVRHHIWSKYNEKYPDQFYYFSSQINSILKSIEIYHKNKTLNIKYNDLNSLYCNTLNQLNTLKKRDLITVTKYIYRKSKTVLKR